MTLRRMLSSKEAGASRALGEIGDGPLKPPLQRGASEFAILSVLCGSEIGYIVRWRTLYWLHSGVCSDFVEIAERLCANYVQQHISRRTVR